MVDEQWPMMPFGELIESFDSVRAPVKGSERKPGPYPYYGASGAIDHVSEYLLDGEFLLVAEDGENLRTQQTPVAFLVRGRFWVNNHAHVVQANAGNVTRYLMYAMRAADIRAYLTGSTMPKLTQANLNRVPVPVPSRTTQQAIAHVLGSLDEKIDVLQQMNRTLEDTCRALFQSWFVDFDPVRAKAAGRKPSGIDAESARLFPNKLEISERGEFPAGWGHVCVGEVCEGLFDGPHATPPEAPEGPIFLGIKNFRPTSLDLSNVRHISETDYPQWTRRVAPRVDDIVFTYEATLGYFALVPPGIRCCLGRRTALVRPRSEANNAHFLFHWFTAPPFQDFLRSHRQLGSTVDRIWLKDFPSYPVLHPSPQVVALFENVVGPMWDKIHLQEAESASLRALRDTLLPKLLSGAIRVPDSLAFADTSRSAQ